MKFDCSTVKYLIYFFSFELLPCSDQLLGFNHINYMSLYFSPVILFTDFKLP